MGVCDGVQSVLAAAIRSRTTPALMVELENAVRGRWKYYHGRGVGSRRDVARGAEPS